MTLTNSLVNTQSAPININLSNNDLKKLEILNKTISANIELMNKRVDFLILKLIKLFLFLFQNKNENQLLTFDHIYYI
jgi:hypothetical protein